MVKEVNCNPAATAHKQNSGIVLLSQPNPTQPILNVLSSQLSKNSLFSAQMRAMAVVVRCSCFLSPPHSPHPQFCPNNSKPHLPGQFPSSSLKMALKIISFISFELWKLSFLLTPVFVTVKSAIKFYDFMFLSLVFEFFLMILAFRSLAQVL